MKNIILSLLFLFPLISFAATSEENRAGKKYDVSLQLAAVDYRLPSTAINGMYFINSNNLIGLKFGSLRGKESQDSIAIQYKTFTGNSFYFAPEVFYLRTREDVNGFWGDILEAHEYATYSSMGASLRIGNQWSWDHFTLGCEWLGIGHRFGTFRKDTHKLNDTTVTLLNLSLGWSF